MSPYSIAIKSNLQRYGFFDVALSGSCMYPILKEGDCARIVAIENPPSVISAYSKMMAINYSPIELFVFGEMKLE